MGDVKMVAETENSANKEVVTPESAAKTETTQAATEVNNAQTSASSSAKVDETKDGEKAPEWTPDYKFKVRDNVFEFDDTIKPLVNKDNHPKIKELYEKAYGLDFAKKRLNEYDEQFKGLNEKAKRLENYETLSTQLDTMLEKGDFASFQKTLQIPDQLIIKRAMEILKTKEMSPEERQEWESRQDSQAKLYALEQQNQSYQRMVMQNAISQRQQQLDGILASPELSSIVKEFDTRAGKPGAFRERVWAYGANIVNTQKIDLSAEDAVKGFLDFANIKLGGLVNENPAPVATQPVATGTPKDTIPNISSSGKSPARKVYNSIADLKKAAENLTI